MIATTSNDELLVSESIEALLNEFESDFLRIHADCIARIAAFRSVEKRSDHTGSMHRYLWLVGHRNKLLVGRTYFQNTVQVLDGLR